MFLAREEPVALDMSMAQNLMVLSVEQVTRHEAGRAPREGREG